LDPRLAPSPQPEIVQSTQGQALSEFSERVANAWTLWRGLDEVSSSLEETRLSEELEVEVVSLEAEGRRLVGTLREGSSDPIVGGEQAAITSLKDLRASLDQARGNRGPSIAHLREVCSAMDSHALAAEHELALEAFAALEPDLVWIAEDPAREPLVDDLKAAAARSSAVLEFDALGYSPTGIAILDGRAAVLVAGRSVVAGARLDDDVIVRSVTSEEVVFEYRGVTIARRVLLYSPLAGER